MVVILQYSIFRVHYLSLFFLNLMILPIHADYLIFAKPALAEASTGLINKATWNNNLTADLYFFQL